jgi:copper chaperone CopZ
MKSAITLLLIGAAFIIGCASSAIVGDTNGQLRIAELKVDGMTCSSCAFGVEYQLKQVPGVVAADVNYPEGTGYVIYDSTQVNADNAAAASEVYRAFVVDDKPYK